MDKGSYTDLATALEETIESSDPLHMKMKNTTNKGSCFLLVSAPNGTASF